MNDDLSHIPVVDVPMEKIYHNSKWNCRGTIEPVEVVDLAQDIAKNGLNEPIILRPLASGPYEYTIVAGHRRHMAFRLNNAKTIPARIKEMSDIDACKLNLKENLLRTQLSILQEARALRPFKEAGWPMFLIAKEFGQQVPWVEVRFMVLNFPPDIQDVVGSGLLTQAEIRHIDSIKDLDKKYEAVRYIKDAKARKETIILKKDVADTKIIKKRALNRAEISDLMMKIYDITGPGLHTRLLAACIGNVSIAEVFSTDIAEYCRINGIDYEVPEFVKEVLAGAI